LIVGFHPRRLLAIAILACGACGTAYHPRPSARVSLAIRHGTPVYVKSALDFPVGPLGGPLEPLVADVPAAVEPARRARHQLSIGVPLYMGGIATVIVGVALSWSPLGWVVFGAGVASTGTGLGFMGAGVTNAVDAVNIHNDGVKDTAPPAGSAP
jgi:hypothetical protein